MVVCQLVVVLLGNLVNHNFKFWRVYGNHFAAMLALQVVVVPLKWFSKFVADFPATRYFRDNVEL